MMLPLMKLFIMKQPPHYQQNLNNQNKVHNKVLKEDLVILMFSKLIMKMKQTKYIMMKKMIQNYKL